MRLGRCVLLLFLLMSVLPLHGASAQEEIRLVVNVPEYMSYIFDDELFGDFEAAHPGVEVIIDLGGQSTFYPPPGYDFDNYLDGIEEQAGSADVFYINFVSPIGTQAGYYLDMLPLVQSDANLNPDDYFSAAWQAYQWDGGMWAFPVTLSVEFLIYDTQRFDGAGVAYPSPEWTLNEFAIAAEALTERDAQGEVTLPGFTAFQNANMLRIFAGRSFFDETQIPAPPNFAAPETEETLQRWLELRESGVVGNPTSFGPDSEFAMMLAPADLMQSWQVDPRRQTSLLPGGFALGSAQGFAISAGTQYPELSYEMVKYLSTNIQIALSMFGTPAYRSLLGAEVPEDSPIFLPELAPELQELIETMLEHTLPPSELRYLDYIDNKLNTLLEEGSTADVGVVLQEAQSQAMSDIQAAVTRREESVLVVEAPPPLPELAPGEVALNFGLFVNISPVPNRERWESFMKDFATSDPEVGYVVLDVGYGGPEHPAEENDCFYGDTFYGQGQNREEYLLTIDPLMTADATLELNDFVPGALDSFRDENGQLWGYPLVIVPQVLAVNTEIFDEAGIPYPRNEWEISEFLSTLDALQVYTGEPAFTNNSFDNSFIKMLMIAFGGTPFDIESDPSLGSLTDPVNTAAVRQVLDLAKNGIINYQALANPGVFGGGGGGEMPAISSQMMSDIDWGFGDPDVVSIFDGLQFVPYPRGSQFLPIAYQIKGAYISNQSANPEACYRLIRAIARQPDLFSAMPAQHSTIAQVSTGRADLFQAFATLLDDPNARIVSSAFGSFEQYLVDFVVNRAYDRYVLEDADLEAELEDARSIAAAIVACIAELPDLDEAATPAEAEAHFNEQRNCAVNVDPTLSALFPPLE